MVFFTVRHLDGGHNPLTPRSQGVRKVRSLQCEAAGTKMLTGQNEGIGRSGRSKTGTLSQSGVGEALCTPGAQPMRGRLYSLLYT